MVGRRKPKTLDAEGLWNYALRLLAHRPYSAGEIKSKLSRRTESASDIAQALEKLREYGLADDAAFSETFASSRLQNDGFGRARVLRDLSTKRVPKSIAEQAVNKTYEKTSELELANQFLQRKYRRENLEELLKDQKKFASAYRKLRMAGFSGASSLSVLKRHAKAASEWPEPDDDAEEIS